VRRGVAAYLSIGGIGTKAEGANILDRILFTRIQESKNPRTQECFGV
jgi:hypothetical protein